MADWWEQPLRIVQTNLREIDAVLDPEKLVRDLKELHANALLINTGGIVSFFPTVLPFQHRSDLLPEGTDLIGAVLAEAHRHGIRVMSRFDLSKCHRDVYEAHPDWFFVDREGKPEIYNDLYQTCLSGPYGMME
jgi:hypothetical protein